MQETPRIMTHKPNTTDALRAEFAPIFKQIAAHTRTHEVERSHPFEEIGWLKEARFGAVRLTESDGGRGASIEQLFLLLVDLGAADSNFPQIWRNHIAFVEGNRVGAASQRWREELAAGKFFGGAWSETGGDSLLDLKTTLTPTEDGYRLNGKKYYSTGSLFSDWVSVLAQSGPETVSVAIVPSDAPGVKLVDDWTGIGQRLSASGTSEFTDVAIQAANVVPFTGRVPYLQAVLQLVHLANLAGIARAAHNDVIAQLRTRKRPHLSSLSKVPLEDPQHHEVVGRVGALAASAQASGLWAARQLDLAADAYYANAATEEVLSLSQRATVAVFEAQITVTEAVLEASTILYDALGSSALQESTLLDRHWRNARTLTSHNPRVAKVRILGDYYLNGTDPVAAILGREQAPHGAASATKANTAPETQVTPHTIPVASVS